MMTAKDAMNKVNAYIEETATAIIAEIEADICAKAEKGTTYTDYMFDTEHFGQVYHKVLAIIADAGYHTRWLNNGALSFSWED